MLEQQIAVVTDDGTMNAFTIGPEDGPAPAVLVFMPPPGVTSDLLDFARRLAEQGYFVIVPDGYYRLGPEVTFSPDQGGPAEFERMKGAMTELTGEMVMSDTRALLAALGDTPGALPGSRACIGLGLGGQRVLEAMAQFPDDFAAGAVLHPPFLVTDAPDSPHLRCAGIKGELYGGFGEDDPLMPVDLVGDLDRRLEQDGVRHEFEIHSGAGHGFMLPGPTYEGAAAERSWQRLLELLGRSLSAQPT